MAQESNRERRMRLEQEAAAAAEAERLKFLEEQAAAEPVVEQPTDTPTEAVGPTDAVEDDTPMPQERPEGILTAVGNVVEDILSGDAMANTLSAITGGALMNAEQLEQRQQARSKEVAEEGSFFEKAVYGTSENLEAIAGGARAGVMLPLTGVAQLTGQATPWSSAPARIKESPIANLLFEFTEIAVPTMLTGGIAGNIMKGVAAGRAVRAGIETAAAQDLDEVLLGRTMAVKFGEIAGAIGAGEPDQVTRDLIEGKSFGSYAFLKTAAFIQSYIFDWGTDAFLGQVFKNYKPEPFVTKAAKAYGVSEDQMKDVLENTYKAAYSNLLEPEDVINGTTVKATVQDFEGKAVSAPALLTEIFRKVGRSAVGEDGLTRANRKYFSNLDVISEEESLQRIVQAITEELPGLKNYNEELAASLERGAQFWKMNEGLLSDNFPAFLNNFAELTIPLYGEGDKMAKSLDMYLRTGATLDFSRPESFVIGTLLSEEMSVTAAKLGTAINNLSDIGVNTEMLENELLQHIKKSQLVLTPLRRAKRAWSLAGKMQQRFTKEEFTRLLDEISIEAANNQGVIMGDIIDEAGNVKAIEDLMTLARNGDTNATKTLKTFYAQLGSGDARQALETIEVGGEIIKKALASGRSDAVSSLFYNVGLLSAVRTMTTAASNTIVRQVIEPLALMGTRAPFTPFSDQARKDFLYGFGQATGGMIHMGEAFHAMAKSFKNNQPISGTGRFKRNWETHLAKQNKLDATYTATRRVLEEEGADASALFYNWADYTLQSLGNNPGLNAPSRFLMSLDSAGQSTAFNGNLNGMAFLKATEEGITVKEAYDILREEALGKSGELFGGIKNPALLDVSKMQTFQRDITVGEDATIASRAFKGLQNTAEDSGLIKFIAPFARISWDFLDQVRLGAAGGLGLHGMLSPTHKKMLSGELGVPMQMQAKSIIAAAQLTTAFAVWRAWSGNMTGKIVGPLEAKDSFIVQDDDIPLVGDTNTGYISLPFSKFQPYSAQMSFTADLVNSYRFGSISRGEYQKGLQEITASFIDNTFDQTTLTGLVNFADLISRGAATKGWLSDITEFVSMPISPSAGRMFGRIASPFQKPLVDRGDPLATAAAALAQKTTGGAGFPENLIMQNLYTNERQANVATFAGGGQQGDDWWEAIRGSLANEIGWPAPIKDSYKKFGWYKLFEETGYAVNRKYLQEVNGIPLDLASQAALSRDIAGLGLGEALTDYYNSGAYQDLMKDYRKEAKRTTTGGGVPGIPIPINPNAQIILDRVRQDIKEIHDDFKIRAVEGGELSRNEEFTRRYEEGKYGRTSYVPGAEDRGLYALAAQEDTPLANQVRDILDIA